MHQRFSDSCLNSKAMMCSGLLGPFFLCSRFSICTYSQASSGTAYFSQLGARLGHRLDSHPLSDFLRSLSNSYPVCLLSQSQQGTITPFRTGSSFTGQIISSCFSPGFEGPILVT